MVSLFYNVFNSVLWNLRIKNQKSAKKIRKDFTSKSKLFSDFYRILRPVGR